MTHSEIIHQFVYGNPVTLYNKLPFQDRKHRIASAEVTAPILAKH